MHNEKWEEEGELTFGIEMVQSRDLKGMESRITWEGELMRLGNSLHREE